MNESRTRSGSFVSQDVPVLCRIELKTTRVLGSGGFCSVSSIRRLTPHGEQETNLTADEIAARHLLSKRFNDYEEKHYSANRIVVPGHTPMADPLEQKPPRIALKELKSSLKNERYRIGAKDLMNEIAILAKCSHPNIITLYAVGCDEDSNGVLPSSMIADRKLSFAIIDQLRSTLRNKMCKWKDDRGVGFITSKDTHNVLWLERLVVMIKVADAVAYLHSKGIMHRDLNPDNIGFADDDVVKLFDFGLARSLAHENALILDGKQEEALSNNDNEIFDLTGTTGTLRYDQE
jgi:serine/threonine protein kinase